MKARMDATKLEDAAVMYISLVPAGANRAPIKIMKMRKPQEKKSMSIDLARLSSVFKTPKAAPVVVALLVEKNDNLDQVKKAVSENGFRVDKMEEAQGKNGSTVLFKQTDEEVVVDRCGVLKISEELVVLVKGYDPYASMAGMPFTDVLKAQNFFPSVSMAMDALRTTMYDALCSGEGGDGMVAKLESDLDAFKGYVLSQAKAIPASVFKMALAIEEIAVKAEKTEETEAQKSEADKQAAKKAEDEKVKKEAKEKADKEAAEKAAKEGQQAAVKTEDPRLDAVLASISSLSATVGTLATAVQGVGTQVAEVKSEQGKAAEALKAVKSVAEAAAKAVGSTLTQTPGMSDEDRLASGTEKAEKLTGGTFDTAYQKGVRKNAFAERFGQSVTSRRSARAS